MSVLLQSFPLWQPDVYSLCFYKSLSFSIFLFCFQIPPESGIRQYFFLFCLTYFICSSYLRVHPVLSQMARSHSSHGHSIHGIAQLSSFIHPSVDGHLGCFPILALVNNAAVEHRGWLYLFGISTASYYKYPGFELLDCVVLFLFYGGTSICFPQYLYHPTFPPKVCRPLFSTSFVSTCYLLSFC